MRRAILRVSFKALREALKLPNNVEIMMACVTGEDRVSLYVQGGTLPNVAEGDPTPIVDAEFEQVDDAAHELARDVLEVDVRDPDGTIKRCTVARIVANSPRPWRFKKWSA